MACPNETDFRILRAERDRLLQEEDEYNRHMSKQIAALKKEIENIRAERRKRPFIWDESIGGFVENTEYASPDPVPAGATRVEKTEQRAREDDIKEETTMKDEKLKPEVVLRKSTGIKGSPDAAQSSAATNAMLGLPVNKAKPQTDVTFTSTKTTEEPAFSTSTKAAAQDIPQPKMHSDSLNKVDQQTTSKKIDINASKASSSTTNKARQVEKKVPPKCFPDIMKPRPSAVVNTMHAGEHKETSSKPSVKRKHLDLDSVVRDSESEGELLDFSGLIKGATKKAKRRHTVLERGPYGDEIANQITSPNVKLVTLKEAEIGSSIGEPEHAMNKSNDPKKIHDGATIHSRIMADITHEEAANASDEELLSLVDLHVPPSGPTGSPKLIPPTDVLPPVACAKLATDIRDLLTPNMSGKKNSLTTMRKNPGSVAICLKSRKLNRPGYRMLDKNACKHCAKPSRGSFCIQIEWYTKRPFVAPLPAEDRVGLSEGNPLFWVKMGGLSA